jgi:actin-related protein
MWLSSLQVAIVEKDTDKLDELLDELPKFKDEVEMKKASYLLREALELLYTLQDETSESMKQIKKNLDFLDSTQNKPTNKLDLKS